LFSPGLKVVLGFLRSQQSWKNIDIFALGEMAALKLVLMA
jgi:hypothetical protein